MTVQSLKQWARQLKQSVYALYLVSRSTETPVLPKLLAVMVVAYALSPIDLIPDFIPIIGYVDDLLLLPIAIWLIIRLVPKPVWQTCLAQAQQQITLPKNKFAAAMIVLLWIIIGLSLFFWWTSLP